MAEKARLEIARRKLFQQAGESIRENPDVAHAQFQQAIHVEFYVGEVEDLLQSKQADLESNREFSEILFKLFININRFKYDTDKYGHMPPKMKAARIDYGEKRLRELFRPIIGNAVEVRR